MQHNPSLFYRVLLLTVVTTMSLVGGLALRQNWDDYHRSLEQLQQQGEESARLLGESLSDPLWELNDGLIESIARASSNQSHFSYLHVTSADWNRELLIGERPEGLGPPVHRFSQDILHQQAGGGGLIQVGRVELALNRLALDDHFSEEMNSDIAMVALLVDNVKYFSHI